MQIEAVGTESQLVLHGRQVSRMLQDHDGVQPRPDGGRLCRLLHGPLPAHRRPGQTHRRMLLPQEAALKREERRRRRRWARRRRNFHPLLRHSRPLTTPELRRRRRRRPSDTIAIGVVDVGAAVAPSFRGAIQRR